MNSILIDNVNKSSQQVIKESNLKLVFNLIVENEPISRAEIKKITKLSATTISSLCEELIENGLIMETGMGEGKTSGRKPILLRVNKTGGCFVSIEILASSLRISIFDLLFNTLVYKIIRINDFDNLGNEIINLIKASLNDNEIKHKILGITIGISAVISDDREHIASSTVVNIDSGNEFMQIIKKEFDGVDVFLCNDSCLVAYAEKNFAANLYVKNLISVDIGDGVGAGIVADGRIYTGNSGLAGEFGHTTIDYRGKQCKCGSYGCLELYTTIPAIIQKVKDKISAGIESVIGTDTECITVDSIKYALDKSSKAEVMVVGEAAMQLSFGLINLINIMAPEIIVISGEIEKLGEHFLNPLKKYVSEKCISKVHRQIPIKYSDIKGNAVALGAANYAFDNVFGQ